MPFHRTRESLTVPGNHLPALLQPLLVALRMERFEDLGFELIVDFFRCLTQDVFRVGAFGNAALGFEEDLFDRFQHSRISIGHDEQRLSQATSHHLL